MDVSSNLKPGDKPGEIADTVPFPPDLSKYDVVREQLQRRSLAGRSFNKALEERVRAGKIGLVIVHAANNAFGGWKEYNQMIGMGWRGTEGRRPRCMLDDSGKEVRIPKGKGDGSGHRYAGTFSVTIRDAEHPITQGHAARVAARPRRAVRQHARPDRERPPAGDRLLARARRPHEPMIWTVSYGKGRVFHTPMGHDANAMRCVGFHDHAAARHRVGRHRQGHAAASRPTSRPRTRVSLLPVP